MYLLIMTSNMALGREVSFLVGICVLFSLQYPVHGRKHHLNLEADTRPQFTISSFGFLKQGTLSVNVTSFVATGSVKDFDNTSFGFTLDVSSSSGAGGYMEDYTDKCILKDKNGNVGEGKNDDLSIVFLRMDLEKKKLMIERRGKALQNLIITDQAVNQFKESTEPAKGNDEKTSNITDATPAVETSKQTILTELPIYVTTDNSEIYSFYFMIAITEKQQEGMYNLIFHNCLNFQETEESEINLVTTNKYISPAGSMDMYSSLKSMIEFYKKILMHNINGAANQLCLKSGTLQHFKIDQSKFMQNSLDLTEDNNGNYLSAGSMPLPALYFCLSLLYLVVAIVWNTVLCKSKEAVYKMHYLMLVVVFVKSLACLFHGINFHFIQKEGTHEEAWAILFYIAYLTRGALLFITIILIGSGWAFIKHVLSEREKKLFLIVIPLQILDNIAWIILEESEEGQSQYTIWKEIFILIDLLCCGAILFPVVWSIRHLQEAAKADGKAELSLTKLKLFRQFYILVVCYIYFTRIIVYLLKMTVPFKYLWLNELFRELATVIFFVTTGYKFKPASDNPYLQVPSDDEDEIEMDTVVVGESSTIDTVKRVNQAYRGEETASTKPKLRESSHEYD